MKLLSVEQNFEILEFSTNEGLIEVAINLVYDYITKNNLNWISKPAELVSRDPQDEQLSEEEGIYVPLYFDQNFDSITKEYFENVILKTLQEIQDCEFMINNTSIFEGLSVDQFDEEIEALNQRILNLKDTMVFEKPSVDVNLLLLVDAYKASHYKDPNPSREEEVLNRLLNGSMTKREALLEFNAIINEAFSEGLNQGFRDAVEETN